MQKLRSPSGIQALPDTQSALDWHGSTLMTPPVWQKALPSVVRAHVQLGSALPQARPGQHVPRTQRLPQRLFPPLHRLRWRRLLAEGVLLVPASTLPIKAARDCRRVLARITIPVRPPWCLGGMGVFS
jgi:hypothetical protein